MHGPWCPAHTARGSSGPLSQALYPTVRDETFFHSCGVGDLIATCYGGRNRLVAEAWTKAYQAGTPTTFEQLEKVWWCLRVPCLGGAGLCSWLLPCAKHAGRDAVTLLAGSTQDLLKGQKLQGTLTSNEVQEILRMRKWEQQYPLFTTTNRIITGVLPPDWVLRYHEGSKVDVTHSGAFEADDMELPRRRKSSSTAASVPKVAA